MLTDSNKGITKITYNHLNLPTKIVFNNQDPITSRRPKAIEYVYDATGMKVSKNVFNGTVIPKNTKYAGNYIYENNTLQFFNHSEGYVNPELVSGSIVGWNYVYQYKDHLGNVRLTYADTNNDGVISAQAEIIEESSYYPFGMLHRGYNNVTTSNGNSVAQKFKYNGVELEESLGLNLYEMEFRSYDPEIGRFNGIDPVTHHSQGTSVAFNNNPIYFADPSGADAESIDEYMSRQMEIDNAIANGFTLNQAHSFIPDNAGNDPSDPECPDGDCIMLDEIVVKGKTNNKTGYEYNAKERELLDYLKKAIPGLYASIIADNKKGIYYPLFTPGAWGNFSEGWAAGWQGWDPDGAGNFWMNFSAVTIGGAMTLGTTSSIFTGYVTTSTATSSIIQFVRYGRFYIQQYARGSGFTGRATQLSTVEGVAVSNYYRSLGLNSIGQGTFQTMTNFSRFENVNRYIRYAITAGLSAAAVSGMIGNKVQKNTKDK